MQLGKFLSNLGYSDSPNFIHGRELSRAPAFGHVFRRAQQTPCHLQGAYALRDTENGGTPSVFPVVYVCKAKTEADADKIHRLVWNQDVVPFLLVHTPANIRLYSGFRHRRVKNCNERGLLLLKEFNEIEDILEGLHAESIDSGRLWKRWGSEVTPQYRVDWELLGNLSKLDHWLRTSAGLHADVSHALIGKYVYLHYLRDRDILSERKLESWGLSPREIFGREATVKGLRAATSCLDEWLNGCVFPLRLGGKDAPRQEHIRRVAATFAGDEPLDSSDWQLHLDFDRYDFSYIPIETLSAIYEQFLHASSGDGEASRGRQSGAYYTPIPVVNLMLSEMEARSPLVEGMKVFDPSCGSGAFLVQCYRRLVEKQFPPKSKSKPRPRQLRELLEKHIFGVDRDADACSVTELSLVLTLLDYVDPPDLENDRRVKLPALRGRNIFHADFFDNGSPHDKTLQGKCDWIVGNPPWKNLNPRKLHEDDHLAWDWMSANDRSMPVGGNHLARAFAWKVADYLSSCGRAALFLPAMTLFEDRATQFRAAFFKRMQVDAVANFANLAEVLSAGRFRVPAAAFFFQPRPTDVSDFSPEDSVATYSPLVARQEATRPTIAGTRGESWNLVINASEIRSVPLCEILDGSGLPWKLATWGSHLDKRLLDRLSRRFPSFGELEDDNVIVASQGLELRRDTEAEPVEYVEEVIGKNVLDIKCLRALREVFTFPDAAIRPVDRDECYARKRGGVTKPLAVCRAPHVIVSAARNFAVYTEDYLIVPPRQIGIVSPTNDKTLLKALSLFLSSDFAYYHQFLTSTQFGVQRARATLTSLRRVPIPFGHLADTTLREWVELHARCLSIRPRALDNEHDAEQLTMDWAGDGNAERESILRELNELVSDSLGLTDRERALVHDLVRLRLELRDGKLGQPAVTPPNGEQILAYARRLKSELDAFIGYEVPKKHSVGVVHDEQSGMIQIELTRKAEDANSVCVSSATSREAAQLERTRRRLREQHAQWVYFNRNLRIYEGRRTFVLKPMQRFEWTESQAMLDAADIIAETLAGEGS